MQSNISTQPRSSCNIITSQLSGRRISHKWTAIYGQTDSPTNAVIAFNKKRNRYVSMTRLLPHMKKIKTENYVFFARRDNCTVVGEDLRIFSEMADQFNKNNFKLQDEIHINVECTENYVEGISFQNRFFCPLPPENMTLSLPGFQCFKAYKKRRR